MVVVLFYIVQNIGFFPSFSAFLRSFFIFSIFFIIYFRFSSFQIFIHIFSLYLLFISSIHYTHFHILENFLSSIYRYFPCLSYIRRRWYYDDIFFSFPSSSRDDIDTPFTLCQLFTNIRIIRPPLPLPCSSRFITFLSRLSLPPTADTFITLPRHNYFLDSFFSLFTATFPFLSFFFCLFTLYNIWCIIIIAMPSRCYWWDMKILIHIHEQYYY